MIVFAEAVSISQRRNRYTKHSPSSWARTRLMHSRLKLTKRMRRPNSHTISATQKRIELARPLAWSYRVNNRTAFWSRRHPDSDESHRVDLHGRRPSYFCRMYKRLDYANTSSFFAIQLFLLENLAELLCSRIAEAFLRLMQAGNEEFGIDEQNVRFETHGWLRIAHRTRRSIFREVLSQEKDLTSQRLRSQLPAKMNIGPSHFENNCIMGPAKILMARSYALISN